MLPNKITSQRFEVIRRISFLLFLFMGFLQGSSQTVRISGYEPDMNYSGFPLFLIKDNSINVSSSLGSFDYVFVDGSEIEYNSSSYWSSYSLNVSEYLDGSVHTLQLFRGSSDYGFCYFSSEVSSQDQDAAFYIVDDEAVLVAVNVNLEEYTIPSTFGFNGTTYPVTSIGQSAFKGCSSLTSVVIPDGVTSIGNAAFYDCSSLASVIIPESVTSIGEHAFSVCSSLTSVKIPKNVTSIEDYCFIDCSSLISVTLPESVTSIGGSAFSGCSSLTSVILPEGVTSIGSYAFFNCSSLTSVVIPESVTSIGNYSFKDCSSLTELTFNAVNCLTCGSLDYPAFPSSIASLEFGEKVTSIPDYFLYNGSLFETVTFPATLTKIGASAFRYGSLTSMMIPEGVTSIGGSAFSGCSELAELTFNAENCTSCGSSSYPAFPSTIKSLSFGDKVTQIPNDAFYGCSTVERIIIPNSVTSIGAYSFNGNKFKSVIIGSGVLSIGSYAFYRNSNSGQIAKAFWLGNTPPSNAGNVNAKVNYVANDQYSLSNQVTYQFLSSMFPVDGSVFVPVSPAERTCDLIDCTYDPEIIEINITDKVSNKGIDLTVKNISQYSYYDNDYVKSVKLSNDGLLGKYVFYGCSGIETLETSNNGNIGEYAFSNCSSLKTVKIENQGNIGDDAISSCSSLETANIKNQGNIGSNAFSNCIKLKGITLGQNVTGILSSAFMNCADIVDLTIPDSVNELGVSAFENCTSLESISIGTGMTSLPNRLFYGDSALSSISVPNNIKEIGNYVFSGCKSLTDVTFEDVEEHDEETIPVKENLTFPDWTSTNNNHSSSSTKEYSIDVDAGDQLSLNYRVSSESGYDYLTITLNGEQVVRVSGENSSTFVKNFNNGMECTLVMSYSKDGSSSSGSDQAMVTDIVVKRENGADVIDDYLTVGSNGSSPLFTNCPLDEIYIGRKLRYHTSSNYGYSPFYRNTSLRSVEISDEETQISPNEFYGCSNLKSITIGNGVSSIGNWAFSGCSSLDYFSAGYNVKTIGQEAFSDCTALTTYHSFSIEPPVCGAQALDDINKWECTLYVPAESSDEYAVAPQWKEFFFVNETDAVIIEGLSLSPEILNGLTGEVAQIEAEITPPNATRRTLSWTSEDESIATVDENGLVTFVKEGATIITARTMDGSALSGSVNVLVSINNPQIGDSNANGVVNIADAVNTANYAIGNEVTNINLVAADVNKDGVITLSDASATVSLILDQPLNDATKRMAPVICKSTNIEYDRLIVENLEVNNEGEAEVIISLDDTRDYVGLQADIVLPVGLEIESVELGNRVADTHILLTKQIDAQTLRTVIFNSSNAVISPVDEPILKLNYKVKEVYPGDIKILNAVAANQSAFEYKLAYLGGEINISTMVDGIADDNVKVYSVDGTLLISGAIDRVVSIFDEDGKIIAKFKASSDSEKLDLVSGLYIVMVDNQTMKVIVE